MRVCSAGDYGPLRCDERRRPKTLLAFSTVELRDQLQKYMKEKEDEYQSVSRSWGPVGLFRGAATGYQDKLKYVTRLYSALDAYERNAENHLSKQNLKTLLKEGAISGLSQKLNDYLEHQYFRFTQPDARRAKLDQQEEVELQLVSSANVTL